MDKVENRSSCLLAPFAVLWRFTAWIIGAVGRIVALVIGFVFILIGVLVSMTIIGLPFGIALLILGSMLIWRGLF